MRSRVQARILASAILVTTICTLAACGHTNSDPAPADPKPATIAPSVPPVPSTPSSAQPAPSHAGTPPSASPTTAAKHSPAPPSPKQQPQQPQPPSAPDARLARFGPVTSEDSTASIDVSADREALTATFADLEMDLEKGAQSAGTRMVIPLTSGAKHATIAIYASGYAFTQDATARLVLTVNGRTVVKDFPAGTDDDFVQPIELPVIAGAEYQLSLALEGHPAIGSDSGVAAYLNVLSIDAEITPA